MRSSFSSRDCSSFLLGFIAADRELVLAAPCPVLLVRGLPAAFLATDPDLPRAMRAFREEAAAFTVAFFAGRAIPVLSLSLMLCVVWACVAFRRYWYTGR
jgi:hypothetical protein